MIDIYLPYIKEGLFRHKDDSFREIILEWGKRGLVNIIRSNEPYIWWGQKNDILLYDWDTFMWFNTYTPKYNIMLCGNETKDLKNSSKWIYWVKHVCNIENLNIVPFNKRQITSIFVGRIENEVQANYRNTDWKKYIEIFDILVAQEGLPYKYTNKEYIDLLRYSKFGLCLRGFGPKCLREIELMACGTIPIITPDVDIYNYYNPPIENIHYIRVSKPEDIPLKINAINEEKWKQMSKACIQWYNQNCSVQGSFDMTNQIINNFKYQNQQIKSITTLTNKNGIFDLTILLRSLEKFHKDIPVFIACDMLVKNHFEKNNYGLKLYFDTCLDKYDGMNEEQMKHNNVFIDFKLEKTNILKNAISEYSNSLFIDSTICLLDYLPVVDLSKDVILCYNNTNQNKDDKFNDSYFFVNNIKFLDWFRTTSKTRSHFFEQQTLDYCYEEFKVGYFPIQNNFGWWRLFECDKPRERLDKFNVQNGQIYYDGQPLRSIHTHFRETTESYTTEFNKFIITLLEKSGNQKDILDFIQKDKKDQKDQNNQSSLKISLIVQTYPEKNVERLEELILCIVNNLKNNNVSRVINLCEGDSDSYLPDIIRDHSRYTCKTGFDRLTYKTAFDYSNEHLNGEIVGLMNTDIMLADDFKISDLHKVLKDKVVIANSRHEIDLSNGNVFLDENFKRMYHANTQDAWFYKAPIIVENADFELGLLGCDNAISHRLQVAGYTVFNMPERFKIIHVDSLRGKNSENFSTFHKKYEVKNKIVNKHPENIGQLLVPNYDAVREMSFDKFLQILGYTEEEKVWLMTRAISEKIKIKN